MTQHLPIIYKFIRGRRGALARSKIRGRLVRWVLGSDDMCQVTVSDPSCFAHYLFAATHGHAQAALTLGVLYETGRGLPQSLVLAHAFYTLARDNGDARAGDLLGELEEHMASDQLAAARQFIDEVTDGATACRSPVVEAFAPTQ